MDILTFPLKVVSPLTNKDPSIVTRSVSVSELSILTFLAVKEVVSMLLAKTFSNVAVSVTIKFATLKSPTTFKLPFIVVSPKTFRFSKVLKPVTLIPPLIVAPPTTLSPLLKLVSVLTINIDSALLRLSIINLFMVATSDTFKVLARKSVLALSTPSTK